MVEPVVSPRAGKTASVQASGGIPSIMTFVAADVLSFVLFFAAFMYDRLAQTSVFNESAARLDINFGLLNTLILITSGWLVARAAIAAKDDNVAGFRANLMGSVIIGLGFGIVKFTEYAAKINQGITAYTNDFFAYYYMLTAIHFLHYIVGIVLLVIILFMMKGREKFSSADLNWIKSSAVYWHMVDLLWILLFPMLYLQGA